MIKMLLHGCCGKMGRTIERLLQDDESMIVSCGVDAFGESYSDFPVYKTLAEVNEDFDVIVDFSSAVAFDELIEYAKLKNAPVVICTTGLSNEQKDKLVSSSVNIPVFFSANMSLGINLLIDLVRRAVSVLGDSYDMEIIEKHHNQKLDSPSGTALAIADAVNEVAKNKKEYIYDRHSARKKRAKSELGIHSVRGGTIVGEHTMLFAGNDEIIEIKHSASSREIFAVGAIRAAKFLTGKSAGLYNMDMLIKEI